MGTDSKGKNPRHEFIEHVYANGHFVGPYKNPEFFDQPSKMKKSKDHIGLLRRYLTDLGTCKAPLQLNHFNCVVPYKPEMEFTLSQRSLKNGRNIVALGVKLPCDSVAQHPQRIMSPPLKIDLDNLQSAMMKESSKDYIRIAPIDDYICPELHEMGAKYIEFRRSTSDLDENGNTLYDKWVASQSDQQWLTDAGYLPTQMSLAEIADRRARDYPVLLAHNERCKKINKFTDCKTVFFRPLTQSKGSLTLDLYPKGASSAPPDEQMYTINHLNSVSHWDHEKLDKAQTWYPLRGLAKLQETSYMKIPSVYFATDLNTPIPPAEFGKLKGKQIYGRIIERVGNIFGGYPVHDGERPKNVTNFVGFVIFVGRPEEVNLDASSALARAFDDNGSDSDDDDLISFKRRKVEQCNESTDLNDNADIAAK